MLRNDYRSQESNQLLSKISHYNEVLWINDKLRPFKEAENNIDLSTAQIDDAENRLEKFAPLIQKLFPETKQDHGIIESPIKNADKLKVYLEKFYNRKISGRLLLKMDSHLAIAGSIKARGGIYEVLKFAEELLLKNNMISKQDDYSVIAEEKFRDFLGKYTIQVGSTGNLGLSIGIMSSALGFEVKVHMSSEAQRWKKDLLISKGVTVIEYESDFSKAVEEGRRISHLDTMSYFIDDENSIDLFLGYSVAARRLEKQLSQMNITVDSEHPLFVYLPCGVGGSPAGITYGLKTVYKDNVHCFFIEPTHSPCMLAGMVTGLHSDICVQDLGLDGKTHADGLAVGRPSRLAGKYMDNILSGIFTVNDNKLYDYMRILHTTEGIDIEPSACASIEGPLMLEALKEGKEYIISCGLKEKINNITHISWATGGKLLPKEIKDKFLRTYL